MQILWIRHGQTQGNVERRYVGRTDEGLTTDAKEKLEMRKQQGIGFEPDLVYASPMLRCRETAALLFPKRRNVSWEGLQETDFGDFEYKNYEELKDDPVYQAWIDSNGQMLIPNGESGADFRKRCCAAYERCVAEAREKELEKIAIVCHGGTIMSVMERYSVPKKSFYEWQVGNGCGILTETTEEGKNGYAISMGLVEEGKNGCVISMGLAEEDRNSRGNLQRATEEGGNGYGIREISRWE